MPGKRPFIEWEFWPFWLLYIPVIVYVAFLAIISRSATFFKYCNPKLKWSGLFDYSKSEVLQQLPQKWRPIEFLHNGNLAETIQEINNHQLTYPIIVKPDFGERGKGVRFIEDENELGNYLNQEQDRYIIQEYIDYEMEMGILAYKIPSTNQFTVFSAMERSLLKVKGDGQSNVKQLLQNHVRYNRYLEKIESFYPEKLNMIPNAGEEMLLEPIGNHNRGTTFLSAMDKIDNDLTNVMKRVFDELDDFYFGRLDIKCRSWEDLKKGEFKVLEINGINSEPAHIYEPGFPLREAYKILFLQWRIILRISLENRKNFPRINAGLMSFTKDLFSR